MKKRIISLILLLVLTINLCSITSNGETEKVAKANATETVGETAPEAQSTESTSEENTTKQPRENPNVSLSIDLRVLPFGRSLLHWTQTHKQLDGYREEPRNFKGLTSKDEKYYLYGVTYPRIVSENKKVIYKNLEDTVSLDIISKYGDEVFFEITTHFSNKSKFYAVNVNTKEVREVFTSREDYSCYPMFYKDKIYYIKTGKGNRNNKTPQGHISVANIDGTFIEHIKLPKFDSYSRFLGIAHDKFYYISIKKGTSRIHCCNLDGSEHKIVAKGFKYNVNGDYNHNISYDKTGWYFTGGKEKSYKNLCRLNFKTGNAKVIKKNVENFDVGAKYIYYTNPKTGYIYRINKTTGKQKLFVKKGAYKLVISGKYLYFTLEKNRGPYIRRRIKIVGPKAGKKIEKIQYLP